MDLFSLMDEKERGRKAPLAERMRPRSLEDVVGHRELLAPGASLYRLIQADRIPSLLFFGPPGSGKTSLAEVIAKTTKRHFNSLSAVSAGIKELREMIDQAKEAFTFDRKETILFIDEIHRFNKSQQDFLLPYVEDGTVTFIGATTENPYFEVNKALLSRVQILELRPLKKEDLNILLQRTLKDKERGLGREKILLEEDAKEALLSISSGDARVLLNSLEIAYLSTPSVDGTVVLTRDDIENSSQKKMYRYDKGEEEHYNTISAFIKSIRGTDPDAAIYYLARMLIGGEDPLFIARRLVILASEDIGNANPLALVVANACMQSVLKIGMPEARIILAQTTTFLATSPKSNSSYEAIDRAIAYIKEKGASDIPNHIKDASYQGAQALDRGTSYLYPHAYPKAYVDQAYLPDSVDEIFYQAKDQGYEKKILDYLHCLKENGRKDVN